MPPRDDAPSDAGSAAEPPPPERHGQPISSEVSPDRALTYGSYLGLEELLSLQRPRSEGPEHDEMLFIVIHQVYELWFKEILHEVDHARKLFEVADAHRAQHTLKRILTILKVLVAQIDILETMTPLEFLSFRERLEAASGFQSDQFRQLEFVLGHKRKGIIAGFPAESRARRALERRWREPTLWDAFLRYLSGEGFQVPDSHLVRDPTHPVKPSEQVQDLLVRAYRENPQIAALCERLVDLDEGMQEWRYRHVKMVERTIGTRQGTGGSAGASYLRSTLGQALFPDLWQIRNRL